jgi:hypothetical protein
MKSYVFWDITARSPLEVNRRFGVTTVEEQAKQASGKPPAFTPVSCLVFFL